MDDDCVVQESPIGRVANRIHRRYASVDPNSPLTWFGQCDTPPFQFRRLNVSRLFWASFMHSANFARGSRQTRGANLPPKRKTCVKPRFFPVDAFFDGGYSLVGPLLL